MFNVMKERSLMGRHQAKRVSNRQLRRMAISEIAQSEKDRAVLFAVLAQCGNEVTITAGTIDQVGRIFDTLGWEISPSKTKNGEYIVRLIEGASNGSDGTADASHEPGAGHDQETGEGPSDRQQPASDDFGSAEPGPGSDAPDA